MLYNDNLFRGPVKIVKEYKGRKEFFLFGKIVKSFSKKGLWKIDKSGHLLQYFHIDDSGIKYKSKYFYDAQWNLQKEVCKDGDVYLFSYDTKGRISQIESPQIKTKWILEYDENGRITKDITMEKKGPTREVLYTYNEQGNIHEVLDHHIEDSYRKYDAKNHLEYNEKGKLIKAIHTFRNETTTEEFKYNEQGDIIERITIQRGKTKVDTYTYEYDQYGNWTKRIENGKKATICEIEYYH